MPRKIVAKKVYKKKTAAKKVIKKKRSNLYISQNMIKYEPKNNNCYPFPSRYRTKLTSNNYGVTAQGGVSGQCRFNFPLNYVFLPFNGTPSNTFTWNGLGIATQNPIGLTTLCNTNFYRNFRVIASKIIVTATPQSPQDSIICTITPSVNTGLPVNAANALSDQWTKQAVFCSGQQASGQAYKNKLSNSITQHKFLGIRRQAIEDDLSLSYTGDFAPTAPLKLLYWIVNIVTEDNAAFTLGVEIKFRVEYDVEFYNDSSTTLPQI